MKFAHLSDLHIGKRVNEFSMLEDQKYILTKILNILDQEKVQAVLIAGDVYDKSVPSAEAVQLFDDFLVSLAKRQLPLFIISGNHDSAERIAFGGRLMSTSQVYLSPVFDGTIQPIELEDQHGSIFVYLLPYLKQVQIKKYFEDAQIDNYTDAFRTLIQSLDIDPNARNILVAHQFVTGGVTCDSEEFSVGGLDNIDAQVFSSFDYVALGHLHAPQNTTAKHMRYCGSPLKYSFSEANHQKSLTIIDLQEKGQIDISQVPLTPLRDMREIKGSYMEVTAKSFYQDMNTYDYIKVILTDEEDIPDAIGRLRSIYPNIMKLEYDNHRTRSSSTIIGPNQTLQKSPLELFQEFYQQQNNQEMTPQQRSLAESLIKKIWEG